MTFIQNWNVRSAAGIVAWRDTLFTSGVGDQDQTFVDALPLSGFVLSGQVAYSALLFGGGSSAAGTRCRGATCLSSHPARSGMIVNGVTSGAIIKPGQTIDIVRVTHDNLPVALSSVFVSTFDSISVIEVTPEGGSAISIPRTFNFNFVETPNNGYLFADGLRCAIGTNGPRGCGDIFILQNATTALASFVQDIAGNRYTFSFSLVDAFGGSFPALSFEACTRVGLAFPQVGFISPEGQINEVFIKMSLTAAVI